LVAQRFARHVSLSTITILTHPSDQELFAQIRTLVGVRRQYYLLRNQRSAWFLRQRRLTGARPMRTTAVLALSIVRSVDMPSPHPSQAHSKPLSKDLSISSTPHFRQKGPSASIRPSACLMPVRKTSLAGAARYGTRSIQPAPNLSTRPPSAGSIGYHLSPRVREGLCQAGFPAPSRQSRTHSSCAALSLLRRSTG
jgi:hypothetical protein